jgi:hypothetical protein
MKKTIIAAVLCFFAYTQSNAQVTFSPGLRGGANFSHFTKGSGTSYDYYSGTSTSSRIDFTSKTDFYVGFFGALHLTKYYTLQPEIDYSRQGATLKSGGTTQKYDVSYLSIAVINKFTFTDKFNVHVGPTIDFKTDNSINIDPDSDVDLAFVLGAGYNVTKNFGLEARIKKGVIPVIDLSSANHSNVVFSLGATYTFDLK